MPAPCSTAWTDFPHFFHIQVSIAKRLQGDVPDSLVNIFTLFYSSTGCCFCFAVQIFLFCLIIHFVLLFNNDVDGYKPILCLMFRAFSRSSRLDTQALHFSTSSDV